MVAVLFAVSLLVFIVFILIPGGDPAERMAGKNPTPENIQNIREKWGFDKPFYVQYVRMMEKAGNGLLPGPHSEYDILRSFDTRQNVVAEIKKGIPATFSLCIGAGIIWLVFGMLVGSDLGGQGRQVVGPGDHDPRADRHLDAGLLARDRAALLLRGDAHAGSRTAATCR